MPGGSASDLADLRRACSQPGTARSAASAAVGRLGRDERDEPALVGDVQGIDARAAPRRPPPPAATGTSSSRTTHAHVRGARELVQRRGDAAAGGVAQAVQVARPPLPSSASTAGHSEHVSERMSASSANSPRASITAIPCSPTGPDTRMRSPGRRPDGAEPGAVVDRRRARSCRRTSGRRGRARPPSCRRRSRCTPAASRGARDGVDLRAQVVGREPLLEHERERRARAAARPPRRGR